MMTEKIRNLLCDYFMWSYILCFGNLISVLTQKENYFTWQSNNNMGMHFFHTDLLLCKKSVFKIINSDRDITM